MGAKIEVFRSLQTVWSMAFYNLSKEERAALVRQMEAMIEKAVQTSQLHPLLLYAADEDTYIRKSTCQALGKICHSRPVAVLQAITTLLQHPGDKVRQTAINAAGEIGRHDFSAVRAYMDRGAHRCSPQRAQCSDRLKTARVRNTLVHAYMAKHFGDI
jgi:hypothetical protein